MSEIWSKIFIGLHVKYLLLLSDFNETWIFSTDFSKKTQISDFMEIRPMGSELFHADGGTDRHDEAIRHFSQFCERAWKKKRTYEQEIMPPYHFVRYETCIDFITPATNRHLSVRRYSVTTELPCTESIKTCNTSRNARCMPQLLVVTQTLQIFGRDFMNQITWRRITDD